MTKLITKTVTSRDFNQDVSGAKRLADSGPVVITDRGKSAYVLMTHEAYERLTGTGPSILDLLNHPESADFEFEPERLKGGPIRAADLK
jgi:hypothetical protein